MRKILIASWLLFALDIQAQTVGKITRVNEFQHKVVIETTTSLRNGDLLIASADCGLIVTRAEPGKAIAYANDCARPSQLRVGRRIASADSAILSRETRMEVEETSTRAKHWRASLGLPLGSTNFEMHGGGADQSINPSSSGLILGMGYQDKIEGRLGYLAEIKLGSITYRNNGYDLKSSPLILSGNGVYAIDPKLNLFVGLNLSNGNYELNYPSNVTASQSPGFGYQLGADFRVASDFGIHVSYTLQRSQVDYGASFNGVSASNSLRIETTGLQIGMNFRF